MKFKRVLPLCVVLSTAALLASALADTMEPAPSSSAPTSSSTFRGTITAVESERDSFTVQAEDNTVKMFTVNASTKSDLTVGAPVTVTYVDSYEWPLKSISISSGSVSQDK
jgi:hypothetical protein